MQTFLPFKDFEKCARSLDRLRLNKMRLEPVQILNVLSGRSTGWRNHPNVVRWKGHEYQLAKYALAMCDEWVRRGYIDNQRKKVLSLLRDSPQWCFRTAKPDWLTDAFCRFHRALLWKKDPIFYQLFFGKGPGFARLLCTEEKILVKAYLRGR